MEKKPIYKTGFQPTTGAEISSAINELEDQQKPIVICLNNEIFDPSHTMLVNKNIQVGIVTNNQTGEESIIIGNLDDFKNKQYTLKTPTTPTPQ